MVVAVGLLQLKGELAQRAKNMWQLGQLVLAVHLGLWAQHFVANPLVEAVVLAAALSGDALLAAVAASGGLLVLSHRVAVAQGDHLGDLEEVEVPLAALVQLAELEVAWGPLG